jgi:hypothetical protein
MVGTRYPHKIIAHDTNAMKASLLALAIEYSGSGGEEDGNLMSLSERAIRFVQAD